MASKEFTFNKNTSLFLMRHTLMFVFIALTYANYLIFDEPSTWSHQATYIKRLIGYYAAPIMMLILMIYFLYEWFKYQNIIVNFTDQKIILNNCIIDIAEVKNISRKYMPRVNSHEYVFYKVIPLAYQKVLTIPMFLKPENKIEFEQALEHFCQKNNIVLESIND